MLKLVSLVALVLFAASIVRADDTRVNNNGGGSPGDEACGSVIYTVASDGSLTGACNATVTTGTITSFSFEVADANTLNSLGQTDGGLTCDSNLTSVGWVESGTFHNLGGIDVCTFTAPTTVSLQTYLYLLATGDPYLGGPTMSTFYNDGDCDLDDFVLGIPVNCGIHTNNLLTDPGISPFVGGALTGLAVSGTNGSFGLPSLPEPGTLSMLLIGLTCLPFVRRRFVR